MSIMERIAAPERAQVKRPWVRVVQTGRGRESGAWVFTWRIKELNGAPAVLNWAQIDHPAFRAERTDLNLELPGNFTLPVTVHGAPGDEVSDAVLQLGLLWQDQKWLVKVRLVARFDKNGHPDTKTEDTTAEPDRTEAPERGPQDELVTQVPSSQDIMALYNSLISYDPLRSATEKLFMDGHYAEAVEEAYKCLNNAVKDKSRLQKDGYDLMLHVFKEDKPILKLNNLKTESDQDEQKGYRFIFAGCMTGIRNPRAHGHDLRDDPSAALEMLVMANHLMRVLERAKRGRSAGASSTKATRKQAVSRPDAPVRGVSAEVGGRLAHLMPELLGEMRADLAKHPLARKFVLLRKGWVYLGGGDELVYYYEDHPELDSKIRILQNYLFINDITSGQVSRYVMTEDFATYLGAP
ncbi:MAG: TIGR02391 family protein [Chloroflexi bacterium]|nr:TIGR02391 family protein [Chloroflexota bacterium]